jgi:hypothetical protein
MIFDKTIKANVAVYYFTDYIILYYLSMFVLLKHLEGRQTSNEAVAA